MKIRTMLLGASLSAAATISLGNAAGAANDLAFANAPVALQSCNLDYQPASEAALGMQYATLAAPPSATGDGLSVSFVNRANIDATYLELTVAAGSQTRKIEDRGSFAPGVTIAHRFDSDLAAQPAVAKCYVSAIGFQDGTTWHADAKNLAANNR